MSGQKRNGLFGVGFQLDNHRVVRSHQSRLGNGFIEVHGVFQLRAGHGSQAAHILLLTRLAVDVFWVGQFRIGALQLGMLIHAHLVRL